MPTSRGSTRRNRLIGGGVLIVLIVAMVFNTKFLTPTALAGIGPKQFDPAASAGDLFTKAQKDVPAQAKPLTEVLPAVQADIKKAAATYQAVKPSDTSYDFPVTVTGTVADSSTADALRLTVGGLPGSTVLVPTSTAINGTVIRDGMGFKFADAPGQTEYQYVGDEIKKLVQSKVIEPLGAPAGLKGKKVTVVGFLSVLAVAGLNTVPKAKPVNIQPVSVQVST